MGAHSLLSPSAAHRWMLCAASVPASANRPEKRDNQDAALGTAKHGCAYECLVRGLPSASYYLKGEWEADGFKFTVDDDFVRDVDYYLGAVRREKGIQVYEKLLDTSDVLGVPDQGGTADCVDLVVEEATLTVVDAKFGFIEVSAQDNPQGLIYIAAARRKYDYLADWQKFRFMIVQPRLDHIDVAEYTLKELVEFEARARRAAQEVVRVSASQPHMIADLMTPSPEACRWCPVRGECPARSRKIAAMFPPMAEEAPAVPLLDDVELAAYLQIVGEVESWCTDIQTEARARALAGKTIPGYKLVDGKKGARFFSDPEKAKARLLEILPEDQVYLPREIISPTEAERRLGKKKYDLELKGLVEQPPGKLNLVPDRAKGQPVQIAPVKFEELPDVKSLL